MKQTPIRAIAGIFFILLFNCLPLMIKAECPDAGFDPGCDPQTCTRADGSYCPIDGGLSALLAIGVGYGIIRYKQSKKASSLSGEN